MATYFGEVLPVFSRAVDDEDNDFVDEKKQGDVIIRWSFSAENSFRNVPEEKINCDYLIFVVDPYVCAFVRDYFLPDGDVPVGVISCGLDSKTKNTVSQLQVTDNACFVHKLPSNTKTLTVLWHHSAQHQAIFNATDKFLKHFILDNLKVVILCTSNISEYSSVQSEDYDGQPLVRSLSTDANKDHVKFPTLEVPNSLTGFPAHVLTSCQIFGIPAVLYVSYHDHMGKLSNFNEFRDILKSYGLTCYTKDKQNKTLTSNYTQSSCYI